MLLGCCAGFADYDLVAANGFDSISFSARALYELSEAEFAALRAKCAAGPLKTLSLNSYYRPGIYLNGPRTDAARTAEYTEAICSRAEALGIRYLGIGAPGCRRVDAGGDFALYRAQFLESLRLLCEIAAKHNMEISLEAVTKVEDNFLTTARDAVTMVRELSLPNLSLVYDLYHEQTDGQPLEAVLDAKPYIRVVHLAENIGNKRCWLQPEKEPLYAAFWQLLSRGGYDYEFTLECMEGDPAAELPRSREILRRVTGR